jgi:ATP-dependent exoDNAse (exonuclease V) beta subunit
MSIVFKASDHSYTSIDDNDIKWVSVTKLVSNFKEPFDAEGVAAKVSKNKKSKWYGKTAKEIQAAWKEESERALELGTFYHNQREADLCSLASIEKEGVTLPIYIPIEKDGVKHAPDQKLSPGIYPEHMVYLKSAGICGQSDLVEVVGDKVNIIDYKSNKKIETESFVNWEGLSKKMLFPVNHLDDCNYYHYALQLSIYMYIILKHNPKLKPGNIYIHHVTFEQESENEFGYPIYAKDSEENPIVKDVTPMEVPYLKDEVIVIIQHIKEHGINTYKI